MLDNANALIGAAMRRLREALGLSQEKLAERAGITYQYLSAIENGKENFTIGVMQAIAAALGVPLDALVEDAYATSRPLTEIERKYLFERAELPPRLTIPHVVAALNHTHKIMRLVNTALARGTGRPLPSFIQGNNFSGIVSNILTDAFSTLTPYKHFHGQRYPDLVCEEDGRRVGGLEVKSTIQIGKGGESHNGHSGWHVVACFQVEQASGEIRFIHVMFAELIGHGQRHADWKYVGSKVNKTTGSRRTETYNTTSAGTTKLRHGTVYLDTSIVDISRWRIDPHIAMSAHSPFRPISRER